MAGGWRLACAAALATAVAALFWFAEGGLDAEPPFVDEAATLAQRRYYPLWAERHHPDWLAPAAYDHGVLHKWWLGFWATHAPGGRPAAVPASLDTWRRWMAGSFTHPDAADLAHARRGSAALATLAALALGWLAWELAGPRAAAVAIALFVGSPLAFRHARLALPDVALVGLVAATFAAAAVALRSAGWRRWAWFAAASLFAALAVLAKLSGLEALLALGVLGVLGLPFRAWRSAALGLLSVPALATVLALAGDPFYLADPPAGTTDGALAGLSPWGRFRAALDHRMRTQAGQARLFPKDFVPPSERPKALLFAGLGRWSFLARKYTVPEATLPWRERLRPADFARGALLGGAAAAAWVWAVVQGWRQRAGGFPRAWLLAAWIAVDAAALARNLQLDWDRYYLLPIGWSSVAAGCLAGWLLRWRRPPA